ncbi:MAG: hypothetical protein E3J78_02240, partial [Candidatus Cloacimonadota bacterium]
WIRGLTSDRTIHSSGLSGLTYKDVNELLFDILKRTRLKPVFALIGTKFDIQEKMDRILLKIGQNRMLFFMDLVEQKTLEEIIVTFIAVLELVKIQKIKMIQQQTFGRIKLYGTSNEMAYS